MFFFWYSFEFNKVIDWPAVVSSIGFRVSPFLAVRLAARSRR